MVPLNESKHTLKRPWNIINHQVYSLETVSDEGRLNMNIMTYVTAVSMEPKLYALAVYQGTKTLDNLIHTGIAVLQFLTIDHLPLVRYLGNQSGCQKDKQTYLQQRDWLRTWENMSILKHLAAVLHLEPVHSVPAGDHFLYTCKVLRSSSFKGYSDLLDLDQLRKHKIIRI